MSQLKTAFVMDPERCIDVQRLQQWRVTMTKQQPTTGPAGNQPGNGDRSPARAKDKNRDVKSKNGDQPGADGPLSAGAEEDTYD
jgi:hypothetical protein